MLVLNEKGLLTNEQIAAWADQAEQLYADALKGKEKPSPATRLGIEETLLRFREHYGDQEPCTFACNKSRNLLRFVISLKGEQANPLVYEDEGSPYDILERLDLSPRYSYRSRRGLNVVTFPVQLPAKKNALLIRLLCAVLLAVLTRLIVSALPGEIGSEYIQPALSGLFKKITLLFSAAATPLVFFSVINGISGLGDVVSFGKVGSRLLKRMMLTYAIAMVIMVIIGGFMGLVTVQASASGDNVFQELLTLVLDMIPNNLVEPFLNDNDLQVIVLSIFLGVIMLGLGEKIDRVRNLCTELGDLVNRMMMVICKLLPLFVYLGISDILLSDRLQNIYKVSQILLLSIAAAALVIIITCFRTVQMTKIPFRELFNAQLPSLLINLTTSSQVSALPESTKCCTEKFGIDERLVNFGLPLGIVVYMPNGAIMLGAMTWVLNVMSAGPADISTVVKIALVAVIVAIAAPPIPGSAFAVMPILFSACGTDLALMPLAVIVASTFGYLLPAMNGFCLQQELLMAAWKSDMVKHK